MSDESIKGPATSNDSLAPALSYISVKTRVKFDGGCLKQDKIIFNHGEIVNIYTVYEINFLDRGYDDYFVLEILCLLLLGRLKLLILINTNILGMVLDLIAVELFWCLLGLAETLQYFLLIWVPLYI